MIKHPPSLLTGIAVLGVSLLTSHACKVNAQQPAAPAAVVAPQTYDYDFGTPATKDLYGSKYTVKATAPIDSKLKSQRIRFTSVLTNGQGTTTTTYFTINTGKYKTVEQLALYLHDTFTQFIAGRPANTEIGKIGDIKYGGEMRFVAVSNDTLRYDTLTQGETPSSGTLSKEDALAFSSILASQLKLKQ